MKQFKGFVIKEFYHIFRDVRTVVILFGIPVVQLLLFGFVITNEIKNVRIAILDHSKDNITQKINDKILSSGYFILDKDIDNVRDIEKNFKYGKIKEVIIFEPDFAKNLDKNGTANLQLIADAADPNIANQIVNYTSALVTDFVRDYNSVNRVNFQIIPKVRMLFNPDLKGVFLFVPGIMAMLLILISALMTSISITREKELGTMEVLLVSPLKPYQIIIGKVLPYIFLAFVDAIVIILMGIYIFGMPVQGNIILLLAECVLYILTALSLGILISTATDSQQVAMTLSLVALMLPTILLSGFIFPVENMPVVLQWLCRVIPPKYFITIIKNIMLKGTGFRYVWKETLVLAAMMTFFLIVSTKKFKRRLE